MAVRYSELVIDGALGDIYDKDAIHEDNFSEWFSQALTGPETKRVLVDMFYPVGTYYITESDVNPSSLLGGTWSKVEGKFIMGTDVNHTVGQEGGYADTVVPKHTHLAESVATAAGDHIHTVSATAAVDGNHYHAVYYALFEESGSTTQHMALSTGGAGVATSWGGAHSHAVSGSALSAGKHTHPIQTSVQSAGEDAVGKNIPPYVAANIWKRIA